MDWKDNPKESSHIPDFYFYLISTLVIFIIFSMFFVYRSYTLLHITLSQIWSMIFILGFILFVGSIFTWKWYLADYYTPKKLLWDEEGIEMINLFGKRVKIPWKYIMTVKYYDQKIFGKWEEAYYVRYNIPENFIFHKNRFWVTKEIGEKLYGYWAKIKASEEWGLSKEELDKIKIEGGDK